MTNKQPTKQEIIDAIKKKANNRSSKISFSSQQKSGKTLAEPKSINTNESVSFIKQKQRVESRDAQIVKQITKPSIESRMSNIIDNRCRYWIENRISQLLASDNFTTREGYSFSIDVDRTSAGLCFRFTKNGTTIAKIDSNGYLYCANVFANGTNLLTIAKFINDINNNSSIYVKHSDLKDGTYVMDIDKITTKTETIKSTVETPLIIPFDNENRYKTIQLGNQTIKADKYEDSLIINNYFKVLDWGYSWMSQVISKAAINSFVNGQSTNEFIFGNDDSKGNALMLTYQHTSDDDANNSVSIGFFDYSSLMNLYRDYINTYSTIYNDGVVYDNNNHYINQSGNLYILNNSLGYNQTKQIIIGKNNNTNYNAGEIKFVNLNGDSSNYLRLALVDSNNTTAHIDIFKDEIDINKLLRLTADIYALNQELKIGTITATGAISTTGTMNANVYYGNVSNITTINATDGTFGNSLTINGTMLANNFNTFSMPATWDNTKSLAENMNMAGFKTIAPCYRTIINFPDAYNTGIFFGAGGSRSFMLTCSKEYSTDDIRVYFNAADGQQDFNYTDMNRYSRLLTHRNFDSVIPNVAYTNRSNTFTSPQTIQAGSLTLMDSNWAHFFYFGYSATTDNCGVLRYEDNMNADEKSVRLYLYGENGLWMTRKKIKFYQPIETNTNCGATINGATTINANSEFGLTYVVPTLSSGTFRKIGVSDGTQTAITGLGRDATGYYAYYKLNGQAANFYVRPTAFSFTGGPVSISQTSYDALQVYNTTANSNVYIWVGNSGADNENRGTFGWVGSATATNRHVAAWCRGVVIQQWFQDRVFIKKPLTVEDQITMTKANALLNMTGGNTGELRITCGDNDYGRFFAGRTASNAGYLEIATADDGNEPIYARQYTGVFATLTRTATILDGSGNTSFPGTLNANGLGSSLKAAIRDFVYPVGALYISYSSTSPATLFGGTWSQITDRFLYCANSSGTTGGEANHTLTINEMPSHTHTTYSNWGGGTYSFGGASFQRGGTAIVPWVGGGDSDGQTIKNYNTGGLNGITQPHNNMPPYITVYCWRRTA